MEIVVCSRCKVNVPREKSTKYCSHKNKSGIVKSYFHCRECNAKRASKYRKTESGKAATAKASQKSNEKTTLKRAARDILNYYIRKGYVLKPNKCTQCDSTKLLEAHHHDYAKPLDVHWLCTGCHADFHRKHDV